jgi:hydrogenase-4 transcriptional activator
MVNRSNIARGDARGEKHGPTAAAAADNSPAGRLEAARLLLDQGRSREAVSGLSALIKSARGDARLLARARVALAEALQMEGRSGEGLAAVAVYEQPEARERLDPETDIEVRAQLGLAFNYTGDYPKAIALLKAALRDAPEQGADAQRGAIYAALARVYRSINEYPIARDHSESALEHYRRAGDWRGLAEGYTGLSLVDILQGNYESGLALSEQAVKLIGDRPAPFLLGKIYGNMAGACWFLKRPHEGIRHLEKAINYYERAEHKANAALGYNNLAINLTLVGRWERAHEALKRALELAFEVDESGVQVPMILDSLGELRMLRGELEDAQGLLERAVKLANETGNKWYARQAMYTLGRCMLATGDLGRALSEGEGALALAEKIGDRQAVCESSLLLAEAHLLRGEAEVSEGLLQKVTELVEDSVSDLALAGESQRLAGLVALRRENPRLAAYHFGRSLSIFELLGDRYRTARAHFESGRAHASFQPERAAESLTSAVRIFRELGARLDLARAEEALAALGYEVPPPSSTAAPPQQQLSIMRLVEAVNSRELLLRELASLLRHEAGASRVLVLEPSEGARYRAAGEQGFAHEESARLLAALNAAASDEEAGRAAERQGGSLVRLRVGNAEPAALFVAPRASVEAAGESLTTLLRLAEVGLDLCAFRERARAGREGAQRASLAEQNLMPGFIHSSPAMKSLVEEIQKIRSSDVTVLVTGESGTGKELVARAVHTVSARRTQSFVPFNCTAVPKELSEGYLFGYRRGAFTGAVSDSPGVIRTAAGGTLFLDEIGDLPLDVQPKLLRFLQEGEIQPLGEQRPQKVDVRIIAATNTDLEAMVADGRFREDLYYRLNVIRLRVPPLRERRSEIPAVVNYYVNHYSEKFKKRDVQVTPEAVDLLMVFDWPGNVRQLTNEIQRIVARAEDGAVVTPEHLSPDIQRAAPRRGAASGPSAAVPSGVSLAEAVEDLERAMIAEALRRHKGNISRAARDLGLTRRGLQLKLGRYRIDASA